MMVPHSISATVSELLAIARGLVKVCCYVYLPLIAVSTALHFPYDTDPSIGTTVLAASTPAADASKRAAQFYEVSYQAGVTEKRGLDYKKTAEINARNAGIEPAVRKFAADYHLQDKKVLEVGSGRGYLQDIVRDYTGLDISPTVASHYHKPFVAGSATKLPFPDNSFDAVWTVWVLEHISEPERALLEMRRVLKPGGVLFLYVAWNCTPWAAHGFEVRPYSEFNWRGKLIKSTIPVRRSPWFMMTWVLPVRALRWAQYTVGGNGTRLRFNANEPNYEVYWQPDSDAVISLDSFETQLWFQSRGDQCLNCGTPGDSITDVKNPLILRISS